VSEPRDVIVIGASPGGLVAAAYLALAGASVTVLEAEAVLGGACASRLPLGDLTAPSGSHTLCALDPRVVKDLMLVRRGLRFAARDLTLIGLRTDGKPLLLGRDAHAAARSIAPCSARDAERFRGFRRDHFAFARAMRVLWWERGALGGAAQRDELRRLSVTSASAMLDAAFESEALKATFAFDALQDGISPADAGSSLLFAWRAAQEMCGLQGAVAIPRGGPAAFVEALAAAAQAAGVEIRTGARVARLLLARDAVSGVALASGEEIAARVVLSSLSRRRTLLELAPAGATGFAAAARLRRYTAEVGEGKLVLALSSAPGFSALQPAGRFVIVERLEGCVAAHAEARAGRLPGELALEAIVPTSVDRTLAPVGTHLLSVLIRPLPVSPPEGWTELSQLVGKRVLALLERHAPGLSASVTAMNFVEPRDCDPQTVEHMLAEWPNRIATPIDGLYLCGKAAEPVSAISGRAARIAAAIVAARLKGEVR